MSRLPALLLSFAFAGAAFAGVSVNGAAVSAGSGAGWFYEAPVVRLTGPGPFVVSGADASGGTVLRAEADCVVVASNLVLDASATGRRARGDDLVLVQSFATDGAGTSVVSAGYGLFVSRSPAAALPPDDPAAAYGSAFVWDDVWARSNVSWEPSDTNRAAVVWTGERFVAARYRGGFMVSEDGAAWRAAAWDGTPENLRAVARDPATGTLVAASTDGLWRSTDGGLSWLQATNLYANAVVRSSGLFVAVGELRGTAKEGVYWSADGASWTARGFSDFAQNLAFVVAGGDGRFLAGNANGWLALRFRDGDLAETRTKAFSGSKFAVASGGGRYVACALANTGLRYSTNGVDWTRADMQDGTFASIVHRNGAFFAEEIDSTGAYSAGCWTSADGASWTRVPDEFEVGLPALDCGTNAVALSLSGTGNGLAGGLYAPAVRVVPGGSLDVAAQGSAAAALQAFGSRYSAAFGGGLGEDAGAFVQRSATLLAAGGAYAPDIGSGYGGAEAGPVTVLGGSLHPAGGGIEPAPSNGVQAVRCVVVDGLEPGASVSLANLPGDYGTDGVVADASGRVYLWLPAAAESFRFIAGGALRRVAAGGNCVVDTLPPPKVEEATFAAPTNGVMEVKIRVSSPVESEALAPVYSSDLSALSSGGGSALAPSRVEQVSDDEYELTFTLPADSPSGFLVIQAK